MAEILAPEDMTPLLWSVMATVQEAPGSGQKQAADCMGVDAVNFGQMIDVLEGKDLIERRIDSSDRRARKLYVTERGASLRQRLRPTLLSAQDRLLAPLSKAERTALLDMLVRVIEANDSYALPGNGRRKPKRKSNPETKGGGRRENDLEGV